MSKLLFGQTNTFPTSGNVGIGTANPAVGLQIGDVSANILSKQILIPGTYNFERLSLGHLGNGHMALEMVNHSNVTSSYGVRLTANVDNGGAGLQFQYAPFQSSYSSLVYQTAMFMGITGNIGIGTTTPLEKLSVNGKIRAHEIKVETANWPDYVFVKDYQLPSLKETEKYINEKGHLPGIPSASDVKANGVDLGEMNAKLLKKIEELTLYMIDIKKDNEFFKAKVHDLEENVKKLKTGDNK